MSQMAVLLRVVQLRAMEDQVPSAAVALMVGVSEESAGILVRAAVVAEVLLDTQETVVTEVMVITAAAVLEQVVAEAAVQVALKLMETLGPEVELESLEPEQVAQAAPAVPADQEALGVNTLLIGLPAARTVVAVKEMVEQIMEARLELVV